MKWFERLDHKNEEHLTNKVYESNAEGRKDRSRSLVEVAVWSQKTGNANSITDKCKGEFDECIVVGGLCVLCKWQFECTKSDRAYF